MTTNPASLMEGQILETGWRVLSPVTRHPSSTGGCFSIGYQVQHLETQELAYLKALNFSGAFQDSDPLRALQSLTTSYNFERDLLKKCGNHRMRRVLTPICDGKHILPHFPGPLNVVFYIIFEHAEGDIRAFHASLQTFDLAWSLRSLHHSAVGLMELHLRGIIHQDLKPSNVLTFADRSSKIADLGRAFDLNIAAPHDDAPIPGDFTYASPEQLYRLSAANGIEDRRASDIYALGNLMVFHFSGLAATQAMLVKFQLMKTPLTNDFSHDLPYWKRAFEEVLQDLELHVAQKAPSIRVKIMQLARELCEPDPELRGDPKARTFKHGSNYTTERYISRFDLLAKTAEIGLYGRI